MAHNSSRSAPASGGATGRRARALPWRCDCSHTFAPLFWHRRGPAGSTTVLAPALWDVHHRGVSRSTVLFPLYLRHRDERAGSTTHGTSTGAGPGPRSC